jgi:chromosome partitioning protein
MRRIALINQKGGVGKTTSTVNLGAALALEGRRVVVVDLDPQANLSLHLDVQLRSGEPSSYTLLLGDGAVEATLRETKTPGLKLLPSCIDLSGAELELSNAFGREMILRDALEQWEERHREAHGEAPADYVLLDCPPSLGLLSVNGLVAAQEAIIVVQTEFFALQGMTKLVDVVQLLRRRLNPSLEISAILPCLYDNRTKLAREVLGELRAHFAGRVFSRAIAKNVKLAEAPSYGKTIFEYAPESSGSSDYREVARELIAMESRDSELVARYGAPATAPVNDPGAAEEAVVTLKPARAPRAKKSAPVRAPAIAPVAESAEAPPSAPDGDPERASNAPSSSKEASPDAENAVLRAKDASAARTVTSTSADMDRSSVDAVSSETEAAQVHSNAPRANGSEVGVDAAFDELPELPPDAELLPRFADS